MIGVGLLACAAVVLWQTLVIPVSPLYSKVGPTVFPYITAIGLALLSPFCSSSQALRGGWQPEDEKETPIDWKAIGFVVAGLVANVVLIKPLGFTRGSSCCSFWSRYGFGSRKPLARCAIGLVLALAAYFGFAKALGVNIGAGVIERLLGG